MPITTKPFDRYVLYHISGAAGTVPYPTQIDCFVGTTRAGIIYFKDSDPIPPPKLTINGIYLYLPTTRLDEILATLRYEKPLHLSIDTTTTHGWLSTSVAEPVGEQEGV